MESKSCIEEITDLISRQEAIDAHCDLCEDKGFCGDICPDVEVFRLISSAQPEFKTGKWAVHNGKIVQYLECPSCGTCLYILSN